MLAGVMISRSIIVNRQIETGHAVPQHLEDDVMSTEVDDESNP